MKKVIVVLFVFFACSFVAASAASVSSPKKLTKGRIVQPQQDTTLNYSGVDLFLPKGQVVILGQRGNGAIVLRGLDLNGVKIEESTISTKGYTVISYQPTSKVVFLNRGDLLTVTDAQGVSSSVAQQGAISTVNAAVTSDNVAELKQAAEREAQAAATEVAALPEFVAELATNSTASEQAVQDVEETLSPSAPR